jgi:hypothetical protein
MSTIFTTIKDVRNWVDSATSNWDDRTDEQVSELVDIVRSNINYGQDASEYLESLPDNLADLLDDDGEFGDIVTGSDGVAHAVSDAGSATELLAYAESEIARLSLGDSETNCHGVVAQDYDGGVRLSDGIGLNVVCRTTEEIDDELEVMAEWYAESK